MISSEERAFGLVNGTVQGHPAARAGTCLYACVDQEEKDFSNPTAAFGLCCGHALLKLMMCQHEPAHQMGTSALCSLL